MLANTFKKEEKEEGETGLLQTNWLLGIIPGTLLLLNCGLEQFVRVLVGRSHSHDREPSNS